MNETKTNNNKGLWIVILAILAVAIVLVFTQLILPKLTENTEGGVVRSVSMEDDTWPLRLIETGLPLYENDFLMSSAYKYGPDGGVATVMYSTQAEIPAIRGHYMKTVDKARETGENSDSSLSLTGEANGHGVTIKNYYSDVANIVSVDMDHNSPNADKIREKIMAGFPEDAVAAEENIAKFTGGPADSGYVLYNFDPYATDSYTGAPIFSRAYGYDGPIEDLKGGIAALKDVYPEGNEAVFEENRALIKNGGYLYTLSAMENDGGVFTVLTVQQMP